MNAQLITRNMQREGYTAREIEDYIDHVADDERRSRQEAEYERKRETEHENHHA